MTASIRTSRSVLVLAASLLLAACSLAPGTPTPAAPLASGWKSVAPQGWVSTAEHQRWQEGRWWALFGDAGLDALMPRVDIGNQNLALAVAQVAQAEALLRQAQAQLWPDLGAQLNAGRSGRPARGSASLGLTASWAPDLWGRLGDAARAQGANVQASQANLAAARLAAQASLAQAYFGLREADAETGLLDEIIAGYERALAITEHNYQVGIAARTDVLQAQSTLEGARSTRVGLQRNRDTLEHAIALLVGEPPAQFSLAPAGWIDAVPTVPPELPSELLLRRPDVAAAERAVVAANAGIGVARAAWFPSLNLSAGVGGAADNLARLASVPTLTWSLGAALAQAIFDAGARDAAIDQAIAAHQAATASYRQRALGALGEVEDQLTALQALAAQLEHTRAAAVAAAGAEQRMLNSYRAGISGYTEVVSAQASALAARRSVMQLQLQRQQAAIALIQALGGGWQASWSGAEGAIATSSSS
ncbi:MAG TPA: efflux transporter outer membrane subunit [Ottowia sp.]|uniref:efflux transporter outer membrane subunit n=1 Tax=Ottowia sp. TaxID=1898956 RepID=UPI002C9823EA|nr:efflux transporter outer membrane subunit [Ottowia sp.]HMN22101.1 efflux transporter outer membrane subunit [Ottowia sp.]